MTTTRWLSAAVIAIAVAAPALAGEPVPVEQEPAHRLRLDNAHVRVFDVRVEAGAATLLHTHLRDGVSIRLADGRVRDETVGSAPVEVAIVRGDVSYARMPEPKTHRVVALGKQPFHNLYVELQEPSAVTDSGAPEGPGLTVELDNDRVRVVRRRLAPGASAPLHTHALPGLGVVLTDGRLEVTDADGQGRVVDVSAGSFQWREAGVTHALRNVGDTPIELVDVDIK